MNQRLDVLRYRFDALMSLGTPALVGVLAFATLALVVVAAWLLVTTGIHPIGDEPLGMGEATWQSLMHAFDPSAVGGSAGWSYRTLMLGVGIGGLFIMSALIGVLTTGLDERLTGLRKGRSRVIERDHTIILGWTANLFSILNELAAANLSRKKPSVVVLADQDKVAIEDAIRERVDLGTTRVVCRTGTALSPSDLALVCPEHARSIIILPPESEDADTQTLKMLMAINQARRKGVSCPVVAALRSPTMMDAARSLGGDDTTILLVDDILARITAQSCRQRGLSTVYQELLSFGGDEIYFIPAGPAAGTTFGAAVHACQGGTVLGLRTANGSILLAPSGSVPIETDHSMIVIAEDEDTASMMENTEWPIDRMQIRVAEPQTLAPEHILILGWNRRASTIIRELDAYVAEGSTLLVATRADIAVAITKMTAELRRLAVQHRKSDFVHRHELEALDAINFDHVIILASELAPDVQTADARTLITLVNLRALMNQARGSGPEAPRTASIVSEMLDVRNRDLADESRVDDFIVSDRLVSLLLAQISEETGLSGVFAELLDAEGAEIYLRDAGDYVTLGEPVTTHTVIAAAADRGEIAMGYILEETSAKRGTLKESDPGNGKTLKLNPAHDESIAFKSGDRMIILAEG